MSYQDVARSGLARPPLSATVPILAQGNRAVEGLLLKLANNVSTLKRHIDVLGTAKDTVEHRHKISDVNRTIQDLAQQTKALLTDTHPPLAAGQGSVQSGQEQQALKHKKLLQDFASILQDYKATQKLAQTREATYLPRPSPQSNRLPTLQPGRGGPPSSSQQQQQQQQIVMEGSQGQEQQLEAALETQALLQAQQAKEAASLDSAVAYNEALIEERDAGIREITRQIGEVNEMFQDLAVLINDQGVQVRTIDEQIVSTAERTKEGTRELVKADRSQRAYQNKCLWLWLLAALVVSLIIIIVF